MFEHNLELLEEISESSAADDLKTIQDMMRWAYSYFNASDLYYGHGLDNPWDESHQLVLSALNLLFNSSIFYSSNKQFLVCYKIR